MTRLVIIGGSDAGISAALRARELAPDSDVEVVLADAYPNFSICGIPYLISGDPDRRTGVDAISGRRGDGAVGTTPSRSASPPPLACPNRVRGARSGTSSRWLTVTR
ncbi:MAG TPA: hypothetical protein VH063_00795 [Gaiellaceae bacterium]|nr:hypothetical protein [Gaiellaceae bacterium]